MTDRYQALLAQAVDAYRGPGWVELREAHKTQGRPVRPTLIFQQLEPDRWLVGEAGAARAFPSTLRGLHWAYAAIRARGRAVRYSELGTSQQAACNAVAVARKWTAEHCPALAGVIGNVHCTKLGVRYDRGHADPEIDAG